MKEKKQFKQLDWEFIQSHKAIIGKAILGIIVLGVAFFVWQGNQKEEEALVITSGGDPPPAQTSDSAITQEAVILPEEKNIVIDVGGQVAAPQVVILPEGARVYQAVEAAGGLTAQADTMHVNMAEALADGDKLYIPSIKESKEEEQPPAGIITNTVKSVAAANSGTGVDGNSVTSSANGLVNINTATSEQLQTLKGVGPSTAEKIIDYRNTYGNFKKIEDLMNVSGIGEKTFEKLKSSITV